MKDENPVSSWEVKIPIATNPIIIRDLIKAFGVAYLIIVVLMGLIFLTQGEFKIILTISYIFLIVMLSLFAISWIATFFIFGKSFYIRYTIFNDGILYETLDKRAKFISNALIIFGALKGAKGPAGTGLITKSQETAFFDFTLIKDFRVNEKRKVITLRNEWRNLVYIYATDESFQTVLEIIKEKVKVEKPLELKRKSPIPKALLYTFLVILASLPLFILPYPFELDLFIPILILCFAAATVWFVPLFGYVVLGGILFVVLRTLVVGFRLETSELFGFTYRNFSLVSADEMVIFGVAAIGCVFLVWFSIKAIRGKFVSVLMGDYLEER